MAGYEDEGEACACFLNGEVDEVVSRSSVDSEAHGGSGAAIVVVESFAIDEPTKSDASADREVCKADLEGCQVVVGAAEKGRNRSLQAIVGCIVDGRDP